MYSDLPECFVETLHKRAAGYLLIPAVSTKRGHYSIGLALELQT